jgi:hypothetical protein
MLPFERTATPDGPLKLAAAPEPSAKPALPLLLPASVVTAPAGVINRMRLLTVSATTTTPAWIDLPIPTPPPWWTETQDVWARNIKTGGVSQQITTDGTTHRDEWPAVSASDGTYVVWTKNDGIDNNIMGKNLGTNGPVFTVAGGPGDERSPSIYGKRVAYLAATDSGPTNVVVATIGSSTPPFEITNDTKLRAAPSIGDHLVAWLEEDGGHLRIYYYDGNVAAKVPGPASATRDMWNPQVSGDRILYNMSNGSDQDLFLFDVRVGRAMNNINEVFPVAATDSDDWYGSIDGNRLAYVSGNAVFFVQEVGSGDEHRLNVLARQDVAVVVRQ